MQSISVYILNRCYKYTSTLSEECRKAILLVCCFDWAMMYSFQFDLHIANFESRECALCGFITLIIMTVFSVNGEIKPVRWNKWLYYPFVAFGIGIIIIRMIHRIGTGYLIYGVELAFILPAFYLVWLNRDDHGTLYNIIAGAFALRGIAYYFFCLYQASNMQLVISNGRVCGTLGNPNTLAMVGVASIMSGLYLIYKYRADIVRLFSAASIGAGGALIIASVSRTALLASIAFIAIILIFSIKRWRLSRESTKLSGMNKGILIIILLLLIIIVMIIIGAGMESIQNRSFRLGNSSQKAIEQDNSSEASQQVEPKSTQDSIDKIEGRLTTTGGLNSLSSGRIGNWKLHIENFSLLGMNFNEFYEKYAEYREVRAHNNIFEYLLCLGIVGIIYIVFFINIGIKGLLILFNKRTIDADNLYLVMAIDAYIIYAMLEIATLPFIRCVPMIFFLSIAPALGESLHYEKGR